MHLLRLLQVLCDVMSKRVAKWNAVSNLWMKSNMDNRIHKFYKLAHDETIERMNLTEMRWIKTMSKNSTIDRINELKERTNDGMNEWIYEGCF